MRLPRSISDRRRLSRMPHISEVMDIITVISSNAGRTITNTVAETTNSALVSIIVTKLVLMRRMVEARRKRLK